MNTQFDTARSVSEHLLEKTGAALMTRDFENFEPYFLLPQQIATFDGERYIETRDELLCLFDAVCTYLEKSGVTQMVRHCVEARFQDKTTVIATHESRFVNRDVITQQPFPVLSVLKYNGSNWQVANSSYAIADRADHNAALMSAGKQIRHNPHKC